MGNSHTGPPSPTEWQTWLKNIIFPQLSWRAVIIQYLQQGCCLHECFLLIPFTPGITSNAFIFPVDTIGPLQTAGSTLCNWTLMVYTQSSTWHNFPSLHLKLATSINFNAQRDLRPITFLKIWYCTFQYLAHEQIFDNESRNQNKTCFCVIVHVYAYKFISSRQYWIFSPLGINMYQMCLVITVIYATCTMVIPTLLCTLFANLSPKITVHISYFEMFVLKPTGLVYLSLYTTEATSGSPFFLVPASI